MKLSEINTAPTYPIVVPSTKKTVSYRPFLVKEEKALLTAQESEDERVMLSTINQVVKACITTPIDNMTTFDLEYIFTMIRSKSVGEYSDIVLKCTECNDPKAKVKQTIDLRKMVVITPENHKKQIKIHDDITIEMKYPRVDELIGISLSKNMEVATLKACISKVYFKEEVFDFTEESDDEITKFFMTLNSKQEAQLEEFIQSMPYVKIDVEFKCPVCGHEHKKELKGLSNFF